MMNKLTIAILVFWSASAVAFAWAKLSEASGVEPKMTMDILYSLHFIFFLIGLGCLIARIIQWRRSNH